MEIISRMLLPILAAGILVACRPNTLERHDEVPEVGSGKYKSCVTPVPEFSGMCYNCSKTAIIAVGGKGDVCEISFAGGFMEKPPCDNGGDWEAMAINHATGGLYLASERDYSVCRPASPYTNPAISKVGAFKLTNDNNKSLEDLTYDRRDFYYYISNQTAPPTIITQPKPVAGNGQTE